MAWHGRVGYEPPAQQPGESPETKGLSRGFPRGLSRPGVCGERASGVALPRKLPLPRKLEGCGCEAGAEGEYSSAEVRCDGLWWMTCLQWSQFYVCLRVGRYARPYKSLTRVIRNPRSREVVSHSKVECTRGSDCLPSSGTKADERVFRDDHWLTSIDARYWSCSCPRSLPRRSPSPGSPLPHSHPELASNVKRQTSMPPRKTPLACGVRNRELLCSGIRLRESTVRLERRSSHQASTFGEYDRVILQPCLPATGFLAPQIAGGTVRPS